MNIEIPDHLPSDVKDSIVRMVSYAVADETRRIRDLDQLLEFAPGHKKLIEQFKSDGTNSRFAPYKLLLLILQQDSPAI